MTQRRSCAIVLTRPDQTRPDQTTHVRNSSLELLRIVAMLMVIATHTNHRGFIFPQDSIIINRIWQQLLGCFGSIANGIFIMLSGYFLIHSPKLDINRILKLWIKIFFYSVVIYVLFLCFGHATFSLKTMLKNLLPVTQNQWWFVSTYFVLYLIHPYINIMIKAMSREDCTKFIKALVIYWCIIPMLTKSDFGANNTINFICMYCFAAYIRLWKPEFTGRKYIWLAVLCIAINLMSVIILSFTSLNWKGYFAGMMRPFTILACAYLLACFRGMNIPYSKYINLLASATFGVYLIHDNNFVRPFLWRTVFKDASCPGNSYFIPYSIAVILTVYISCTVIELIRAKVFKTLSGGRLS